MLGLGRIADNGDYRSSQAGFYYAAGPGVGRLGVLGPCLEERHDRVEQETHLPALCRLTCSRVSRAAPPIFYVREVASSTGDARPSQ